MIQAITPICDKVTQATTSTYDKVTQNNSCNFKFKCAALSLNKKT